MNVLFLLVLSLIWSPQLYAEDTPPLPLGLEEASPSDTDEPSLPEGLGLDEEAETSPVTIEEEDAKHLPFRLSGFWEARVGFRTQRDPTEKEASIG